MTILNHKLITLCLECIESSMQCAGNSKLHSTKFTAKAHRF